MVYGLPQGRSHDFATAQGQQTPVADVSFFVRTIKDYQLVTIENEVLEATQTNAQAFVSQAMLQRDKALRNLMNNVSFELYGDGSATRGVIASATGTGPYVITLASVQQIVQFEVGMTLQNVTITAGTVTINAAGATGVVTNVNRNTGVVTVNAATNAAWALAGNRLVVAGDVAAGALTTQTQRALCGLQAWCPSTAPISGDNFWGVDRSVDTTRLAGIRYDATSYTIEEGLTNALGLLDREGARPEIGVMDFASYTSLLNSIGAKVQYVQLEHDEADVSFQGVRFQSAYGPVNIMADRNCPAQTCFLLDLSSWKLRSTGRIPHILNYGSIEGLDGLRVGSADAVEIRIGYYGNLVCNAPGHNAIVSLSA